jgi:hypothetical protein
MVYEFTEKVACWCARVVRRRVYVFVVCVLFVVVGVRCCCSSGHSCCVLVSSCCRRRAGGWGPLIFLLFSSFLFLFLWSSRKFYRCSKHQNRNFIYRFRFVYIINTIIMASPKLDPKMLILPLVFIFGKKIDWKDPFVVMVAQRGFMTGEILE